MFAFYFEKDNSLSILLSSIFQNYAIRFLQTFSFDWVENIVRKKYVLVHILRITLPDTCLFVNSDN
jgi:hypothetical protein